MKRVPLFLGLAVTVVSLASCEKELENVPAPTTAAATVSAAQQKTSFLTAADWKLTAQTVTTAGVETDLLVMIKPTERDNLARFQAAGAYVLDEGATKRDADRPQQTTGAWHLSPAADSLTVTAASGKIGRYAVIELTATTLRLTRTESATAGRPATVFTSAYAH